MTPVIWFNSANTELAIYKPVIMNTPEDVFKKLRSVQHKYSQYFVDGKFDIYSCVFIRWEEPLKVNVLNQLPYQIKHDVEILFPN